MIGEIVMSKRVYEVNADYRMKIVNHLKNFGYYNGILVKMDIQRKFISGELKLTDIIQNKKDYKELKMSIKAVINYCNDNNFVEIKNTMEYFYKVECLEIKKKYGSIFDRM